MEELVGQALAICRSMWKYRWPAVLTSWFVGLITLVVAVKLPESYEASARIYVDTQTILQPLMAGIAVQPNLDQQVAMLSRTLINRPTIERLDRMANPGQTDDTQLNRDQRIDALMKTLQIQNAGRDNLYTLSYRDSDPGRAKRIVQSLVSIFVESSVGASRRDADSAKEFINEQIKSYQAKLEEAEGRLKEFRVRNIEMQSSDGRDSATRLADLGTQLETARLELREAEQSRAAAKAALDGEKAQASNLSTQSLLQESAISVATPEIDARIDAQRRSLDALLQRFTEEHPDVVATRRLVRELEEQKRKEVVELRRTAMMSPATTTSSTSSPAYQELNRMMAAADVQVAALRARVGEYQARVSQARARLKDAPRIEAEAAQLNRDYAIHKKAYEDLVTRRESATMSGKLDDSSSLADFRLIDPPRVSPKPVAPNRPFVLALAMVVSIGSGLAFAFLLAQLRPAFHRPSELRERVSLPLLGVVSLVMTDRDRMRERLEVLRFGLTSGSLVVIFAIGIAISAALRAQ